MKAALKGVIHGKIIELDQKPEFLDGQAVNVTVEPVSPAMPPASLQALEALRRAAGAWSDDPIGLEDYLEWNRQQRKLGRPDVSE